MIILITKPKAGIQLNRAHPLTRGLVGYWIMNEGGGIRINDISGYGNHGSAVNLAVNTWTGSQFGGAINLASASSQIVTMGNVLDFTTNNFSISFWFRSTSGTSGYMVSKTAVAGDGYLVYFNGSGRPAFFLQTNASNWRQITASASVNKADGRWHHFVGVRLGASDPVLYGYIDGAYGLFDSPQSSGTVTTITNSGDFQLSNSVQYYDGSIDEVRIYNRALTTDEVTHLYSNPHADLMLGRYIFNQYYPDYKINNNRGIRPRPFAPGHAR